MRFAGVIEYVRDADRVVEGTPHRGGGRGGTDQRNRIAAGRDFCHELIHLRHDLGFAGEIHAEGGRLRLRLHDDGKQPLLIKTVRGAGYVFSADVSVSAS